jgi:HMG (high mobility group) box
LLFRRDYARKMKEQYPKESNRGFSIKCGQLWNRASQEVKDNYILQAEEIKRNSSNPIRRKRHYITKKLENIKLTHNYVIFLTALIKNM